MKTDLLDKPLRSREWAGLLFAQALSIGNLEAAAACFTRDACLVTQDETSIHGRDHIRPVLAQLIARRTQIEVDFRTVLASGDVALARERWTIRADGVEGSRFEQTASPTLILHLVEDSWKLAIAAPWGRGYRLEA